MGVLSSKIIFAGGSSWDGDTKQRTARVDAFDTATNEWKELPSLPVAVNDPAYVTVGGHMIVFGGSDGPHLLQDAYSFNGSSWKVRLDLRLPEPRIYASALTDGKRIYVVGGLQAQDNFASASREVWTIDPAHSSGGWTRLPDCPCSPRVNFGAAFVQNKIVLIGGLAGKAGAPTNLSDIWSLDLATKAWKHEGDLPEGRRAMGVSTVGDDIYIFGGYTDNFRTDVLRIRNGSIAQIGTVPEAVAAAPFVRVGSRWYITGGEVGVHIRGKNTWSGTLSGAD
ncbi:MAG: hypothetical protein JSS95_01100 [Acidobacteria bacterium]|nr:hypothetical protein [Acidobacteriota bacterium]